MAYGTSGTSKGGQLISKEKQEEITNTVISSITTLCQQDDTFKLPRGYNLTKEVKDAMLILSETKDKSMRPVLASCSPSTIALALRRMVYNGLSVSRGQCFPISYDGTLKMDPSYFGYISMVENMFPGYRVKAQVVNEGDELQIEVDDFGTKKVHHIINDPANADNPIKYAYAKLVDENSKVVVATEVMTMKQIQTSWNQSHNKSQEVHKTFPDQMAKRTVINRLCKPYVKAHASEINVYQAEAFRSVAEDGDLNDEHDLRDVTPQEKEKAKAIKSKSHGAKGLEALLNEEEPAEAVVVETPVEEPKPVKEAPKAAPPQDEIDFGGIPF